MAPWARWLSYDGTRWAYDETLHVFDRARAICREIAIDCDKPASAVASAKTVAAVERLPGPTAAWPPRSMQWDANRWIFNTGEDDSDDR